MNIYRKFKFIEYIFLHSKRLRRMYAPLTQESEVVGSLSSRTAKRLHKNLSQKTKKTNKKDWRNASLGGWGEEGLFSFSKMSFYYMT